MHTSPSILKSPFRPCLCHCRVLTCMFAVRSAGRLIPHSECPLAYIPVPRTGTNCSNVLPRQWFLSLVPYTVRTAPLPVAFHQEAILASSPDIFKGSNNTTHWISLNFLGIFGLGAFPKVAYPVNLGIPRNRLCLSQ